MSDRKRVRVEELRKLGTDLLVGVGVEPASASAFVSGLLWNDAAGAAALGFASLAGWLDSVGRGEIDPSTVGRVGQEHAATAVLHGSRGLPATILARAARVAGEKAREVGVGIVHVDNLPRFQPGSAGSVASSIAIGPMIGSVSGPGGSWAIAIPSPSGLPLVYDSDFAGSEAVPAAWPFPSPNGWVSPLLGEDEWVVTATAVVAFGSLDEIRGRVGAYLSRTERLPGEVRPAEWTRNREAHLSDGLPVDEELLRALEARVRRSTVDRSPGELRR